MFESGHNLVSSSLKINSVSASAALENSHGLPSFIPSRGILLTLLLLGEASFLKYSPTLLEELHSKMNGMEHH